MVPDNFAKALLRSAATDAPAADSKARAIAHVGQLVGGAGVATAVVGGGALAAARTLTAAKAALAAAVVAGAVGLGGGYELGRSASSPSPVTSAAPEPSTSAPVEPHVAALTTSPRASASSVATPTPALVDACTLAPVVTADKCSAQKTGASVTFAIKSRCSEASLDVFWIDESCREIFRGIVAPGETFWQDSWEAHVFRVRDHETHRLLNELTPARVEGAEDRTKYWKGPPTELPVVVVRENDVPLREAAIPECPRGGGRAAVLHIRNERKGAPIALMRIDGHCKESGSPHMIAPGTTYDTHTSEGHAFRVRDASGALLTDVVPTFLDTTTYITVP